MKVFDWLQQRTIETGISVRFDRQHRFTLRRMLDAAGFHTYVIENDGKHEVLAVKRFLFDRFRGLVHELVARDATAAAPQHFDEVVSFKGKAWIRLTSSVSDLATVTIKDMTVEEPTSGVLHIARGSLIPLENLLFDARVGHPNDLLNRIVAYHKAFHFTFAEATASLNSGFQLRKSFMEQRLPYLPSVGLKVGSLAKLAAEGDLGPLAKPASGAAGTAENPLFKSRLGERSADNPYAVDLSLLFGKGKVSQADQNFDKASERAKAANGEHTFALDIDAGNIKHLTSQSWQCELTQEDSQTFRESFAQDRHAEFFVGFEMLDVIHRDGHSRLKSLRLPLYYVPVTLTESGRQLVLKPKENGRVYLNHLGLAHVIEAFSPQEQAEQSIQQFFRSLLAQRILVNGSEGRIYLSRNLPVVEDVFEKTREVLLGPPGENGKGGLLSFLKCLAIECEAGQVMLYRAAKPDSALQQGLALDLDTILSTAAEEPSRFYKSLLGGFLAPEIKTTEKKPASDVPFYEQAYIPGALPKSTRRLMTAVNRHNLILLEGPPGTGKTHTILNLLIHGICSGQRLLIVSDKDAAIHALAEKIQEYLLQLTQDLGMAPIAKETWHHAIKVVDMPGDAAPASVDLWVKQLSQTLGFEKNRETSWPVIDEAWSASIKECDKEMAQITRTLQKTLERHLGPKAKAKDRVTPKFAQQTTDEDIRQVANFVRFLGFGEAQKGAHRVKTMLQKFIAEREQLAAAKQPELYAEFALPEEISQESVEYLQFLEDLMKVLMKVKPKSFKSLDLALKNIEPSATTLYLRQVWFKAFPPKEHVVLRGWRIVKAMFNHPVRPLLRELGKMAFDTRALAVELKKLPDPSVLNQVRAIHDALGPGHKGAIPLALEVCRSAVKPYEIEEYAAALPGTSSHELLEKLAAIQARRDLLVGQLFIAKLGGIAEKSSQSQDERSSSPLTRLSVLAEQLRSAAYLDEVTDAYDDFRKLLWENFPVWICRKQAVPLLFPCKEQSFDLVIVDEATQCRVDDALPLLYRAKKLMAVGDDKQTVLAKNSVMDDYLFAEFNLDEHLRGTQARGIKGGGSHLFGLVKAIKQGHVLLDEHFRCPPDIISYSNQYVYNNELKVMQWRTREQKPSVVVEGTMELRSGTGGRRDQGQFKGIETDMIDRFLDFVAKCIEEIEKETGKKVDVENEVALCYFLLKNEPYVKAAKGDWLRKLGRGHDVLDGAGAALQGKERDYIFYLWDITKHNVAFFRQGDDADKRKGELNVLMSRPRKRAYHYVHREFVNLDPSKASIVDFLRQIQEKQGQKEKKTGFLPRKMQPGKQFLPWRRTSGPLMLALLDSGRKDGCEFGVVVGDAKRRVDLVVLREADKGHVAIVDLAGFEPHAGLAQDVMDYYFQLYRAKPRLVPYFVFMHELLDEQHPLRSELAMVWQDLGPRKLKKPS